MSEQLAQLRKDQDAYGHEIQDFWKGDEAFEIIEREDGFIDVGTDVKGYFAEYVDWSPQEQEGLKHLALGRSLDLGCGAGRVELYLQSLGREVTGIDNSPLAIQVCRERGVLDARLLPVAEITPALGTFSNIIMYGNNWGLMANKKQARRLLRIFHRMTTPTARIIAETNDIYNTSNPLHLAYQAWNRERGRMPGQIRLRVRCRLHKTPWFDYLMVSKPELEAILQGTGWQVLEYIDSQASQYVAVMGKC
ncbi:MAG: class I SAM-dependent methyltransferase [Anaerolineaceae bacterium]|nr:class I SAM-dependent methyltransferase [Anaerolineaceae bacterium]